MAFDADPHANPPLVTAGAPLDAASVAVVLIHGRGSTAEDIIGLARPLAVPGCAFVAPQAALRTWYPQSFMAPTDANEPWLSSARRMVEALVARLDEDGPGRERTFLAGFSQGACLAIDVAVRIGAPLAGAIAYTGGLIGPPDSDFSTTGKDLDGASILLAAGDPDPHVPFARVEQTAEVCRRLGATVDVRRYPGMPHTINEEELALSRAMIERLVGSLSS
ncbi:MAG: dienelactone hydrolase family protein [Acidobacteriota bacterium]